MQVGGGAAIGSQLAIGSSTLKERDCSGSGRDEGTWSDEAPPHGGSGHGTHLPMGQQLANNGTKLRYDGDRIRSKLA